MGPHGLCPERDLIPQTTSTMLKPYALEGNDLMVTEEHGVESIVPGHYQNQNGLKDSHP